MDRGHEGRLRLFAALTPPEAVLDEIERWWRSARLALPRRQWRHMPRENWHLTLAFYGEIEGGLLGDLELALARELAGATAPRVGSRGIGTFPGPVRPRTFWLGIEGTALDELAGRCRRAAAILPTPDRHDDPYPFRPHLTLARTRRPRPLDLHRLAAMPPPPCLNWRADGVDLYRSRLHSDGARYEILAHYPLADAAGEDATPGR